MGLCQVIRHLTTPAILALVCDQFPFPKKYESVAKFAILEEFLRDFTLTVRVIPTFILEEEMELKHFGMYYYISGIFLLTSFLMLMFLRKWLLRVPIQKKSVIVRMIKCSKLARQIARRTESGTRKESWLNLASHSYGDRIPEDIRRTSAYALIFTVLLVQALQRLVSDRFETILSKFSMKISGEYELKESTLTILPSIINIIFLPILFFGILPLMKRFNICQTDLRKLSIGILTLAATNIITAGIMLKQESEVPKLPEISKAHIRIFNNKFEVMQVAIPMLGIYTDIEPMEYYMNKDLQVDEILTTPFNYSCGSYKNIRGVIQISERFSESYFVNESGNFVEYIENTLRHAKYKPVIRLIVNSKKDPDITLSCLREKILKKTNYKIQYVVKEGDCAVHILNEEFNFNLDLGGVYNIMLTEKDEGGFGSSIQAITEPNRMTILYCIPIFLLYSISEIFFEVYLFTFLYTQSPTRMKTIGISLYWLHRMCGKYFLELLDYIIDIKIDSTRLFVYAAYVVISYIAFLIANIYYHYTDTELDNDELSDEGEY